MSNAKLSLIITCILTIVGYETMEYQAPWLFRIYATIGFVITLKTAIESIVDAIRNPEN